MKPPSRARSGSSGRKRPRQLGRPARHARRVATCAPGAAPRQAARRRRARRRSAAGRGDANASRSAADRAARRARRGRRESARRYRAQRRKARRADASRSRWLGDESRTAVEPRLDRGRIGERRGQPSASSRAPAPVTVRSMAASRLPCRSPVKLSRQFEIAPRRRVDLHDVAAAMRRGRLSARQAALAASARHSRRARRRPRARRGRSRRSPSSARDAVKRLQPLARRSRCRSARAGSGVKLGPYRPNRSRQLRAWRAAARAAASRRARAAPARAGELGRARRCIANSPVEISSQAMAELARRIGEGGEVIVAARIEQRVLGERAGRDDAHHVAAHRRDLPPRFLASAGSSICSQTATRKPWRISARDRPRRHAPARRTSGCPRPHACRAW